MSLPSASLLFFRLSASLSSLSCLHSRNRRAEIGSNGEFSIPTPVVLPDFQPECSSFESEWPPQRRIRRRK